MKEKGFKFESLFPTEVELKTAQQEAEQRQSLSEVDPALILDGKRRRDSAPHEESNASSAKRIKTENNDHAEAPPRKHNLQADEEAEF